jgi:hypothetical protein
MAPLSFSEINYNNNNNNNNLNQFQKDATLVQHNKQYQTAIKEKEIAGQPNFKPNEQTLPPNTPKEQINYSTPAPRTAWTNVQQSWPPQQFNNVFNRFQTMEHLSSDDHIIALLQEICFISKIIMILFILLVVAKIFEKK